MTRRLAVLVNCDLCETEGLDESHASLVSFNWAGVNLELDTCTDCYSSLEELSIGDIVKHSRIRRDKNLTCTECGFEAANQSGFTRHVRTVHGATEAPKTEGATCDECGFVARNPNGLNIHRLRKHGGQW